MIVVRQVYHVKFGHSHQAVQLLTELLKDEMALVPAKVMTDISGRDFTVVMEGEFEDIASWEAMRQEGYKKPEFADWFDRFQEVVETSFTEIYTLEYSQG